MPGARIADIGCGYQASLSRSLLNEVGHVTLLDLAIAPDLAENPKVTLLVGPFEDQVGTISDGSLDTVFCISVLEHLRDDRLALAEFRRILRPGGALVVNVPSWWGKTALEFSAFRLKLSPREEMDDHKRYYDPRDLWPLLVEAGFVPHGIRCRRHKFGLNTLAVCRVEEPYREDKK
jgi:SAM-dependent methyltransferase